MTGIGTPKQENWFERIGNFLSSKDEQVLGEDGRVLPTTTALPTWGVNSVFKNKQQVGNVFKDPSTLFTNNLKNQIPVSEGTSTKLITLEDGSVRRVPSSTNIPGAKDIPGSNTDNFPKSDATATKEIPENDYWSVEGQKEISKDYLKNLAEQSKDLNLFQFGLGEASKLPDRLSIGNVMKRRSYENQADRSLEWAKSVMSNMRLPLTSFRYDLQQFG